MNLDRFCIFLTLLHLPILFLPKEFLFCGVLSGILIGCVGVFYRDTLIFLLGFLLCISYAQVDQIAKNAENITAIKALKSFEITQILKQTDYQTAIAKLESGDKIYLSWQAEQSLELNQHYRAELTIRPISARSNLGNFDRQKWYFAQNITKTATVKKAEKLNIRVSSFRTKWLNRAKKQTEDLVTQGLLLALAFGERAWLSSFHWEAFQKTATAHLIAISGLHIALAMAFGFYLAKGIQWLLLSSRIPLLQAVGFSYLFTRICGFLFAFSYSYLAGFAIPTVRALLAISFVLLCQFCRRHYTAWQFWWRVVALLIVLDPRTLLSDSFWLSILAVASLIVWYQFFPLSRFIHFENRKEISKFLPQFSRLLLSLFHLQIGIWLIFSPVQLYFFQGISPFALIANLIIVPLYSFFLVPLILFSLLSDDLFSTWQLADLLSRSSLALLAPLTDFWWDLSYRQQWHLLSVNLLILLLVYCKSYNLRYLKWLQAFTVALSLNLSFYFPKLLPQAKTEWITFDVGQGLAMALVYEGNKAVLYDSGASWQSADGSVNSMAKNELLPYLKRRGISVEAIFLSHDDNDHSGGISELLQVYPNARFISSSQILYRNIQSEPCIKGKTWQFGQWHLTAVYPSQIVKQAKNRDSCIILAKNDRLQILFTGDSGTEQERQFAPDVGKVDFLQVGHHGSKSSTSETLLAITQPKIAIISAGRWNPWKLPNNQIVERLTSKGIRVLNTAETGMVRIKFYSNSIEIEQGRQPSSPWYKQYY
ncbi:DNA internalization-related competence protein ComEC/Rec2 [Mannheimia granulomatis]|uniref:DNA internalization-related competence protein ComEC/Rec2 n=1 Tax=Mannheimia granulomatis TaxID=85402 RepID=A0A6G8JI16_9PAST|nr:DNA internalization-related competence protein ComEC/Rec2 [Mannheimia granulomatis]QIM66623.1 DNA internalization-related competence protein ComEC/Rec2 [Mannheimia granulomatis]